MTYRVYLTDTFPALILNGQRTADWQYVRKTNNYNSNGPVSSFTFIAKTMRMFTLTCRYLLPRLKM